MKCRVNTIDPHAFWPIKHGLVLFINYVIRHKSESIIEYNANQVPNMVVGNLTHSIPHCYIFLLIFYHKLKAEVLILYEMKVSVANSHASRF